MVEIIQKERQKPLFKGMKISQFHIDIVNKYINEMLSGRLNIKEVMQIINEKAEKENLMDVAINYPSKLMMSPSLMYALIEYAKERHKTTDLSDITRTNIFMPNSTLKHLYGVTHEEIKEKYYVDDIFKEKRGKSINRTEEQYLIEIKEEKWYKKIFLFIKQLFNK